MEVYISEMLNQLTISTIFTRCYAWLLAFIDTLSQTREHRQDRAKAIFRISSEEMKRKKALNRSAAYWAQMGI